jgi:hypothetical protein
MLTDLDVSAAIEQDVVTLDVSVDDVQVVQVFQSLTGLFVVSKCPDFWHTSHITYLETDSSDLVFGNGGIVIDDVGQSTSLHKLHDYPELELLFLQKCI